MFPPRYYLAGQDSLHVLTFDNQTPDTNSVAYTVRDLTGTAILTAQIPTSATQPTEKLATILAVNNAKTLSVEPRFIDWTWTLLGTPKSARMVYKLIDYLLFTVTPDDVRKKFGLSPQELPDADIDLVDSYFQLDGSFTTSLASLLAGSYANSSAVNQCVLLTECLRLIPSCPTRMAKSQTSGSESFTRGKIDWEVLEAKLRADLDDSMLLLQPLALAPVYFMKTTGTDPVYG